MTIFYYTALKGTNIVSGQIEANSLKEARDVLRGSNIVPTRISERNDGDSEKLRLKQKRPQALKKLSLREQIDFTNILYVLSKTGISIIEALLFIEMQVTDKNVRGVAIELRKHLLGGAKLSDAFAKFPNLFDQTYVGLIKAGEESGELDSTLERMIYLLDKQDKLKSKTVSTMVYPVFIVTLASLVTLLMLTFVYPAFKEMYEQMGKKLPLITEILINIGIFLKTYWIIIPIIIVSVIYLMTFLNKWPVSRKIIHKYILKIPVIKTIIEFAALSNFLSVMKIAFEAGIPILDSLLLSIHTIKNLTIKESMKEAATKIKQGQSFSVALKSTGVIPPIIMCMISTGEQSGQLSEMLEQASTYVDIQLDRAVELLNKLVEPFLLVFIGGIVLVLALALYLPLFQSYSNMM